MKLKFVFTALMLSMCLYSQTRSTVEELHNKKWAYLIEKAAISASDAEKIKPLFMSFEQSIWKHAEANRAKVKNFYKDKQNRTRDDYRMMNQQYVDSELHRAEKLRSYYNRLQKILTEEQIFKYLMAERAYKRELMKNWKSQRRNPSQ